MNKIKKENIHCPRCHKTGTWSSTNPFRPFCSARCKLIDLGQWSSEEHRIPGEPTKPDENTEQKDEGLD